MDSDTRKISLAELRQLGDVSAAEEHCLQQEIDTVLRKSFEEQLGYLAKQLNVGTESLSPVVEWVIETIQRRHLLVHNGGVVNQRYFDHVPESVIEEGITSGEELDISAEYLRVSIDRVHLAGLILIHLGWRKWFPAEVENADDDVHKHQFFALQSCRFELAKWIAEFAVKHVKCSEGMRLYHVLNLAQAHKWLNDDEAMRQVLGAEDWSACALCYQLPLAALHDDAQEFFRLLPLVASTEQLDRSSIETWPIFQRMREDPRFAEALTTSYGESAGPREEAA